MQRDWDSELVEDREFRIGGQVFEWAYPHWEISAGLWDGDDQKSEEDEKRPETNGKFSFRADTEYAIKNMPIFLNPKQDSHARWQQLVDRTEDPVPRHQIVQLYRWLFEVASGLPTSPPSDSEPGGGDSAEPSEGESS